MMQGLKHAKAMPLQHVNAAVIQKALKTAEMVHLTKKYMIIARILTKKTTTIMDSIVELPSWLKTTWAIGIQ
jgi:hypothetical protein